MDGRRFWMYSGERRDAMSRKTPPCGLPRPALTSALMARATSSRGSRSGVRRLFFLSSYQPSASFSVSAVSERKNSGMYLNMKRTPSEFFSVPPSPRTPSVTRRPRTLVGQTMPVGWNWMHSTSMRSAPVLEEPLEVALHVHVYALVHCVLLERADHLESGPVAHVRQARVLVAAEVALGDEAILGAIEERAPLLQLEHAVRRLHGVRLGHAPVIEHLAAAHGVPEVDLPVVLLPHIAHGRCDAALGHDRMGLAEERLADERGPGALGRSLDCGSDAGSAGADHDDVVLVEIVGFAGH